MANLGTLSDPGGVADGLWCSFTAAFFPTLPLVLAAWARHLQPGTWVALTEIDDLFGHKPLSARTKTLTESKTLEIPPVPDILSVFTAVLAGTSG
jgi:hypothetical protein